MPNFLPLGFLLSNWKIVGLVIIALAFAGTIAYASIQSARADKFKAELKTAKIQTAYWKGEYGKSVVAIKKQNDAVDKWKAAADAQSIKVVTASHKIEELRSTFSRAVKRIQEVATVRIISNCGERDDASKWANEQWRELWAN
jgi:uncharacterized coiled-coil DUF342 family protein